MNISIVRRWLQPIVNGVVVLLFLRHNFRSKRINKTAMTKSLAFPQFDSWHFIFGFLVIRGKKWIETKRKKLKIKQRKRCNADQFVLVGAREILFCLCVFNDMHSIRRTSNAISCDLWPLTPPILLPQLFNLNKNSIQHGNEKLLTNFMVWKLCPILTYELWLCVSLFASLTD